MQPGKYKFALFLFLAAAVAFGLVARLEPVLTAPPKKLVTYTADDMFYYLKVVDHWARTGTPSFDGEVKTNGFHPLYAMLLLPLLQATDPSILQVRTALLMLVLFDGLAAFFLFLLMRRAGYPSAGVFLASVWLLLPFAMDVCASGMESSLVAACLAYCCFAFLGVRQHPQAPLARLWFGLSLALLFLSRTDSGWYVAILVGWLLLVDLFHSTDRTTFGRMLIAPAVSLALVSPWLILNDVVFGSPVQKSLMAHIVRGAYTGAGRISVEGAALRDLGSLADDLSRGALLPILALCLVAWAASLRKEKAPTQKGLELSVLLLVATFFWYAFYWFVGLAPHVHYMTAPVLTLVIVLGLWLASSLSSQIRTGRTPVAAGIAAVAGLLIVSLSLGSYRNHFATGPVFWQESVYEAAAKMNLYLPPKARAAAFNSGIIGYFSGRYVLNIDGVVNPEAIPLYDRHTLETYLKEKKIDYLIDHTHWLSVYQPAFGEPIADNYELLFIEKSPMFGDLLCLKRIEKEKTP